VGHFSDFYLAIVGSLGSIFNGFIRYFIIIFATFFKRLFFIFHKNKDLLGVEL
jgi:hypothetical protein